MSIYLKRNLQSQTWLNLNSNGLFGNWRDRYLNLQSQTGYLKLAILADQLDDLLVVNAGGEEASVTLVVLDFIAKNLFLLSRLELPALNYGKDRM